KEARASHRVDHTRVVAARGIAEEVDRDVELAADVHPRAVHLLPQLLVVDSGEIRMRDGVSVDLPAGRNQVTHSPGREAESGSEVANLEIQNAGPVELA